ncbi:hypothetical protein [Falsiroseomonas sp.]|uniref:hypothetical protein n=1 Tax=Falsiroseomonas sp. TaxID=2870721 RepID=UPI003F722E4C
MPVVTDVRVTLRVFSSDHLVPRAVQGSAIVLEASITDLEDVPLPGAVVHLSYVTPGGLELRAPGRISNAAGQATARLALAEAGRFVARCIVISPIARVVQRPFLLTEGAVVLLPAEAVPIATPQGALLILPNGRAIGGVIP